MSEVDPRIVTIPNRQTWEYQSLEQLCSHVGRGTAPRYVEKSDVKAIGQRCVSKKGFDSSFARPHSDRAMDGTLQAIVGDVLLNSTGTGTIGRSVVFRESGTFIVDGHVTALRPKVSKCSSTWLSAVLQSPWGQSHLERFCYAGSTNQIELSASALRVSAVPAPSYDEQSKIAEILDTLDAAIRGTEAVVAKLKAMKQGLLYDLLTRGIDANGDFRPPQPEAPHLYKQTPLGWLPKEWDAVQLGDQLIGVPKNGYSPQDAGRETGVKMLGLGCLTEDGFEPRQLKNATEAMALHPARLEHGDLLISRSNTMAMVGRVGRYRDVGAPCIYPDLMMKLVPSARYLPEFLELLLQSERTRRQIQNVAVGTSGSMVKINSKTVRALLIPLVGKKEQTRILDAQSSIKGKLALESAELEKLRLQKFGLMDDLLTGETSVTALL